MREMQGSRRHTEVEVKLRFESADTARRRLDALGARTLGPREHEHNVCWDRDLALSSAGELLRVRRRGSGAWLTYKAPVEGERRHKVRVEHETGVADPDALTRILEDLGYAPVYRYEKYRTRYAWEELAIALDETPIGCFVELEGPADSIDRAAERLGFAAHEYVTETYLELHESAAAEQGTSRGDLLFARGEAPGP